MNTMLSLVQQQKDKQIMKDSFQGGLQTFFQNQAANYFKSAQEKIIKQNTSENIEQFDSALQDFAHNSSKNILCLLKQNQMVQEPQQDLESVIEKMISQYMSQNDICTTKSHKQISSSSKFGALSKNSKRKLILVLTLERYALCEVRSQKLVKQKVNGNILNENLENQLANFKKQQSRFAKIVRKQLVEMQMEVEISKFDEAVAGEIPAETRLEEALVRFVIEPFGFRLPQLLSDLFSELNFSESLVVMLKESKKTKKRQLSAQKQHGAGHCVLNDYSKPASQRKQRKPQNQDVTTQTDFIIPQQNNIQIPATSLLQKRTFSSCFVTDQPKAVFKSSNRINMIISKAVSQNEQQQAAVGKSKYESQQPLEQTQDSMFQNSVQMSNLEQDEMQPPLKLQKIESMLSNDRFATKRAELDAKPQFSATNKFDSQSYKMVKSLSKSSSFLSASNPLQRQQSRPSGQRMNFRASQITTSRVKSKNFNSQKGAQTAITPSMKINSASSLLIEDSKQGKLSKGSVLNRFKARSNGHQCTQASTQPSQDERKISQNRKTAELSSERSIGLFN